MTTKDESAAVAYFMKKYNNIITVLYSGVWGGW